MELIHFERIEETGQWLETVLKGPEAGFEVNGQRIVLEDIIDRRFLGKGI